MFSIDDFVEKIHHLPLEINRRLYLIQELDRRAMIAKDMMKNIQEELRQSLRVSPPPPPTKKGTVNFSGEQKGIIERLDKAQTEYYHLSEEKCKITDQIFTEIQIQNDELQSEAKRCNNLNSNSLANSTISGGDFEQTPQSLKKQLKNERKRANRLNNLSENNEDYPSSSNKQQTKNEMNHQPSSLNSSIFEGQSSFPISHQHHNGMDLSDAQQENGGNSKKNQRYSKSQFLRHTVCCKKNAGEEIMCDSCSNWYHQACVNEKSSFENSWFCKKCRDNSAENDSVKNTPTKNLRNSSNIQKHSKLPHN